MNAIISVICYKSKTLSNGEHPLMLRVAQNGKSRYKGLGLSVQAKHWDFDRNEPKPTCPNKELINKIILKTRLEFQEKLLEKKANEEEFTASSLIHEQKDSIKAQTVEEFYLSLVNDLREKGQVGTSYAYLNSYRMHKNFNKGKKLNYTFSHINVSFCRKYEEWLRARGNKDTSISYQFRTLRAAFNRAIEAKAVSRDKNPFTEYKLSHLNTNFGAVDATLTMWQFYNLLTGANKSSYVDSFLDRALNATEIAVGIKEALHGDETYKWFVD